MDKGIMYEHDYCEPEEHPEWLPECMNKSKGYDWLREHCEKMLEKPLSPNSRAEHQAVLKLIWKDTAWNKIIQEIEDWGAYIHKTDGETDILKGIKFCRSIIKKHLYCD